jgi:hypothetical protein
VNFLNKYRGERLRKLRPTTIHVNIIINNIEAKVRPTTNKYRDEGSMFKFHSVHTY